MGMRALNCTRRGFDAMWYFCFILSLLLAPLLPGIINKTKAFYAGRHGPRLMQLYHDIAKLLRKGTVRSTTSTWVLTVAPSLSLAATLTAALFMPFGVTPSPLAFEGDLVVFFYILAAGRMATVLGSLDTGSAFEGMGASREVQFSALCEAVSFAVIAFLAMLTGRLSLSSALNGFDSTAWSQTGTSMALAVAAFFVALLSENSRVPFGDPETHLELTMVHEAMVLDNSGPDFALIEYASAIKLWLMVSFIVLLILPFHPSSSIVPTLLYFAGVFIMTIVIGVVESVIARFRFLKVPQVFAGALALALVAIMIFSFFKI